MAICVTQRRLPEKDIQTLLWLRRLWTETARRNWWLFVTFCFCRRPYKQASFRPVTKQSLKPNLKCVCRLLPDSLYLLWVVSWLFLSKVLPFHDFTLRKRNTTIAWLFGRDSSSSLSRHFHVFYLYYYLNLLLKNYWLPTKQSESIRILRLSGHKGFQLKVKHNFYALRFGKKLGKLNKDIRQMLLEKPILGFSVLFGVVMTLLRLLLWTMTWW